MADFNLSLQNRLENLKSEVARGYEDANKLKIDLAQDKSKIGKQCLKYIDLFWHTIPVNPLFLRLF